MRIRLTVDDGAADEMDLDAFLADNESMVESGEAGDIIAALTTGKAYHAGGGASPVFCVEPVSA